MTARTLPRLSEAHREDGLVGISAARAALAALDRPCRPHDWRPHVDGLVCRRCARVLTASDDPHRKAAALTALSKRWQRHAIDAAHAQLFPNIGDPA